jgi:hypothetical protein
VYAVATTEGALLLVQGEIRVWRDGRFVAAESTAFSGLRASLAALPHGDYAAALRAIREPPAGWDAARDPCSDPGRMRVGKALLAELSPDDPERLSTVNEMLGLLMCSTPLRPE